MLRKFGSVTCYASRLKWIVLILHFPEQTAVISPQGFCTRLDGAKHHFSLIWFFTRPTYNPKVFLVRCTLRRTFVDIKQDHLRMNVAPDQTIILGRQIFLDHRSLISIGQKILMILHPPFLIPLFQFKEFVGGRLNVFGVLFIIFLSSYLSAFFVFLS